MHKYVDNNRLHGTTTVGLQCKDGVVLATDTRATAGYLFIAHRGVKKIARIDEHVALTIAGSVADAQNMIDILRYHANIYKIENRVSIPIKSVARLAANVFFAQRFYPLLAQIIVGGHDDDGPAVYNVDFFGSLNREVYVSTGSGSPVAYGILENEFREDMSVDEAAKVAIKAIAAAIKRNAGTGDGIDAVIIDRNGYRELSRQFIGLTLNE